MSAKIRLVKVGDGITTAKETWLDELTKPEKAEEERGREVREYIDHLAELNHKRMAEIEALKAQARRLAEHAALLQRVEEQTQERTREADQELENEFRGLADQWYQETRLLSSTSEIVSNETYYQIVGLGRRIIPLILQELQGRGGHWFLALRALTKVNPVKPADRGNMRKMSQAWLDWGEKEGYM